MKAPLLILGRGEHDIPLSPEVINIPDAEGERTRRIPMESIHYFVEIGNPLPRKFCRFVTKGLPRVPARQAKQAYSGAKQMTIFMATLWFRMCRDGKPF